jgi:hypothetical protein
MLRARKHDLQTTSLQWHHSPFSDSKYFWIHQRILQIFKPKRCYVCWFLSERKQSPYDDCKDVVCISFFLALSMIEINVLWFRFSQIFVKKLKRKSYNILKCLFLHFIIL